MLADSTLRTNLLTEYGATAAEIEELLNYNHNAFSAIAPPQFPLDSESHVAVWQEYCTNAQTVGVFAELSKRLVQLQFPIQSGMSQTETYRAATRKGTSIKDTTGLCLQEPENLQLIIHCPSTLVETTHFSGRL